MRALRKQRGSIGPAVWVRLPGPLPVQRVVADSPASFSGKALQSPGQVAEDGKDRAAVGGESQEPTPPSTSPLVAKLYPEGGGVGVKAPRGGEGARSAPEPRSKTIRLVFHAWRRWRPSRPIALILGQKGSSLLPGIGHDNSRSIRDWSTRGLPRCPCAGSICPGNLADEGATPRNPQSRGYRGVGTARK